MTDEEKRILDRLSDPNVKVTPKGIETGGSEKKSAWNAENWPVVGPMMSGSFDELTFHGLPAILAGADKVDDAVSDAANWARQKAGYEPLPFQRGNTVGEHSQSVENAKQSSPNIDKASRYFPSVLRQALSAYGLSRIAPGLGAPTVPSAVASGGVGAGLDSTIINSVDSRMARERGEADAPQGLVASAKPSEVLKDMSIGALTGGIFQGGANALSKGSRTASSLPKTSEGTLKSGPFSVPGLPEDMIAPIKALHDEATASGMQMTLPELIRAHGIRVMNEGTPDAIRRGTDITSMADTYAQKTAKEATPNPELGNWKNRAETTNDLISGPRTAATQQAADDLAADAAAKGGTKQNMFNIGVAADEYIKRANAMAPDELGTPPGLLTGAPQKDSAAQMMWAVREMQNELRTATDPARIASLQQGIQAFEAKIPQSMRDYPAARERAQNTAALSDAVSNPPPPSPSAAAPRGGGVNINVGDPLTMVAGQVGKWGIGQGVNAIKSVSANTGARSAGTIMKDPMKALDLLQGGRTPGTYAGQTMFQELLSDPEFQAMMSRLQERL